MNLFRRLYCQIGLLSNDEKISMNGMRTWEVEKNVLSIFSFQLWWRCGYVRKHREKRGGREEKKTDTKRFSHGDKEMKFHAYFYVRFGTHDMLNFLCSDAMSIDNDEPALTEQTDEDNGIYSHILEYVHYCTMYIQRIGDILLAIKFTHDIITQARMKTTKKTMRISDLKFCAYFFCFPLSFNQVHFTLFIGIQRWPTVKKNDRINVKMCAVRIMYFLFFASSSWVGFYHW